MKKIKEKNNWSWIIKITVITFVISFLFTLMSDTVIPKVNIIISIILILLFIVIGVMADVVGLAAAASSTKSFHSMSARKVKAAPLAIKIVENSEKVSSFCNDVLGDICGIVSGSGGAALSIMISKKFGTSLVIVSLLITSLIASLTVSGKAAFKAYAVRDSEKIIFRVAKILSFLNNNVFD